MFNLDFETEELQFPAHPRHSIMAETIKKELTRQGLKNHFLILSSGTTSHTIKGYALSRDALFANARAVNEHFGLNSNDVWGLSIPWYHVGGLSVLIRAHVLGAKLIDLGNWAPLSWCRKVSEVSITTVVPTQVYDLVQHKIRAPSNLKYLVVGGDFLSAELEKRALDLGWPIIRTFGMTEVCSQLASSRAPLAPLEVLPIHEVKTDEGRLLVKSRSLFTSEFRLGDSLQTKSSADFCKDGFYITNDLVKISGHSITHQGRIDDQVKICGKLVPFNELRERLYLFALNNGLYGKVELFLEDDARSGKKLILLHLPGVRPPLDLLLPLKLAAREVTKFERTGLGKLKKSVTAHTLT